MDDSENQAKDVAGEHVSGDATETSHEAERNAVLTNSIDRISALESDLSDVRDFLARNAPAVETHIEATVQGIVDFLHRLFPAHDAPGVPTSAKAE